MELLLAAVAIGIICMATTVIYCIVAGRKESKHAPSVYCQFVSEKPKSSPKSYEIKEIKHMNIQQSKSKRNNIVNNTPSYSENNSEKGRGRVKKINIEGFLK